MTLTQRGWMLGAGAIVLAGAGRLLAIAELFLVGAGAAALVVIAVAYVRLGRFELDATRQLRPSRVHAGADSRVELTVRNAGRRRSPVLAVRDPFDGGRRAARFLLAPLVPDETARAAYRLPTDRRGVFDLGPLQLQLGDPFGLATRSVEAVARTKLTVYPRIDVIEPLPLTRGNDPHAGADHPTALASVGEDFYALREYDRGDDLRRVHWKATARVDDLMVRQDEMPWQGRATVLLDLRQRVHTPQSLEIAVSAAASIVSAGWRHRSLVRLVTTGGLDSGFAAGQPHVEAILEHLAEAGPDPGGQLTPVVTSLHREGNGGTLAVVTTADASGAELEAVGRLRSRFGVVTLVLLERSAADPSAPRVNTPAPASASVVRVGAGQPFAAAWTALAARRPRAGASR